MPRAVFSSIPARPAPSPSQSTAPGSLHGFRWLRLSALPSAPTSSRAASPRSPWLASLVLCGGLLLSSCSILPKFEDVNDAALARYAAATEATPNHAHAWYQLGRAQLAAARASDARDSFARAIQIAPAFIEARIAFGEAELALGNTETARAAWEEVLRMRPASAPAHARLGELALRERALAAAETHFLSALRTQPKDSASLRGLGETYYRGNRLPEALEAWRRSLETDPGQPELRDDVRDLESYLKAYPQPRLSTLPAPAAPAPAETRRP